MVLLIDLYSQAGGIHTYEQPGAIVRDSIVASSLRFGSFIEIGL